MAYKAGVPKAAFEVLAIGAEDTPMFGEMICTDDKVKKISFTGSTRVGKILMKQCAEGGIVKKASMELGGNAPFVVFADADLDVAVKAAMVSKFRNAGQTCVCSDRFLLHEDIEEEFLGLLVKEVEKLRVGDGAVAGVTMGPLISLQAREVVEEKVRLRPLSVAKTRSEAIRLSPQHVKLTRRSLHVTRHSSLVTRRRLRTRSPTAQKFSSEARGTSLGRGTTSRQCFGGSVCRTIFSRQRPSGR